MNRLSFVSHRGLTTHLSEKGQAIGAPSVAWWIDHYVVHQIVPGLQAPRSQVLHGDLLCMKVTCDT